VAEQAKRAREGPGRDTGLRVPVPAEACRDRKCPFHGDVRVRGRLLEGLVATAKMSNTVVVERGYLKYNPKYMRSERRRSRIPAHSPPCLGVEEGDRVLVGECRPLSKTVHHVVVERRVSRGVD